jgi:hypothetical protein
VLEFYSAYEIEFLLPYGLSSAYRYGIYDALEVVHDVILSVPKIEQRRTKDAFISINSFVTFGSCIFRAD